MQLNSYFRYIRHLGDHLLTNIQLEREKKIMKGLRDWLATIGNGLIMIVLVLLLGVSILGIPRGGNLTGVPAGEIQMGMVVVLAVVVLLTVLYLVVAGFSKFGLVTSQHALGLPEGSIRALIALFLIMIFVIVGGYLFRTIAGKAGERLENLTTAQVAELGGQVFDIEQSQEGTFNVTLRAGVTDAGEQLGLQIATILGTLVTAVSAFYFGSTTATAAAQRGATESPSMPSVDSITPNTAAATTGSVETVIIGSGFVAGAQVKLERSGVPSIDAKPPTFVNESTIKCLFDLTGQNNLWDVVVINPDKNQAKKEGAFQIT